jgi:sporulation protein YlmC with PRC-barrel domain
MAAAGRSLGKARRHRRLPPKGDAMHFKYDAKVVDAEGKPAGHIDRVVLDPNTGTVTHLVVRKGLLLTEDRVVPIDLVAASDDDELRLRSAAGRLDGLPRFEETHYVPVGPMGTGDLETTAPPYYWYPPVVGFQPIGSSAAAAYGYPAPGFASETERNIPGYTVALKEGSEVKSRDGHKLGTVTEVIVASPSAPGRAATHLVLAGEQNQRKLIPAHWVAGANDDEIFLAVDAHLVNGLRDYGAG